MIMYGLWAISYGSKFILQIARSVFRLKMVV